jgi:uncharacterized protein YkwD
MLRKVFFGIGTLIILILSTACQKADASVPAVTPTVTVTPTPTATIKPTPTATIAPTPIPTETPNPENVFVEKIFNFVNEARVENGLNELELSQSLCAAAKLRADEHQQRVEIELSKEGNTLSNFEEWMPNEKAHSRLNGDSFGTVLDEVGITKWKWAGENLYYSSQSEFGAIAEANRAFSGWKNSPSHWENILYEDFTKTGIAITYHDGNYCVCQLFTTGHVEAPEYAEPSPTITP